MKRIMKTVQSSYLHLSNILSNQVEFLSWIIKSSFSTWFKFSNSTSQLNSTLFQKNFNSTQRSQSNYDEKIFKKIITHKILLNLIIESYKKLTVSMLITDIDYHEVILSKLWMNKNEILLNMQNNVIVFLNQLNTSISIFWILLNSKHLSWLWSSSLFSIIQTKTFMMLKWFIRKKSFSIQSINAALFKTL